ncbi:MAG: biotin transporter BioY [Spirochaetales bacterium]|nr:biotin transporter BioY [Spirochaetales bacterium]MCF7939102.1 biotin transporter BioY [Spirochaetales bacterium]
MHDIDKANIDTRRETPTPNLAGRTTDLSLAAALSALTTLGAYIIIPIGPVPIVLQNFFVLLTGLLLRPRWAVVSMGAYLALGAAGLPVFSGGGGGIGHLLGPTGGYLMSYLPAAVVVSLLSRSLDRLSRRKEAGKRLLPALTAALIGVGIIYAGGAPWLKMQLGLDWSKALAIGVLPFLPADIIKAAAAAGIARAAAGLIPSHMGKASTNRNGGHE